MARPAEQGCASGRLQSLLRTRGESCVPLAENEQFQTRGERALLRRSRGEETMPIAARSPEKP